KALHMQQMVDALGERDVLGAVIAAAARPLERLQLRETRFPISEHMRRHPDAHRQFADRQHGARRLAVIIGHAGPRQRSGESYFPATRARIDWLARKVITRRGRIGTSTPVLGLRPIRCALSRSTKVPKPEIFTFCPTASASDI